MSFDYFDDEFLEKIPSIAPDLMFSEESANQQKNEQKTRLIEETKKIDETILEDDAELEITVEQGDVLVDVDDSEPNTPKLEIPIESTTVSNENTNTEQLSNKTISFSAVDKESLLNFIIDDHAYALPFGPVKQEDDITCITSVLKLHPKDLPAKKKYRKRGDQGKPLNDDEIDVVSVDKPDEMLVRFVI